ncbi:Heterokaryon incompatibility protein (HET) domain containing protein [Hyaloscypha variabilis]
MATSYQYASLGPRQIRLIKSAIRGNEGNMEISMEAFNIEEAPPFIAMSYCWAGQLPDRSVKVENGMRFLRVTSNVEALINLMLSWKPWHPFWIDAVCINQENTPEKNMQVSLMSSIYSQAAHCVVWLGHGNESIEIAVEALPELVAEASAWSRQNGPRRLGPHEEEYAKMDVTARIQTAWTGLEQLMCLPWFRRVWIIQEAVIPDDLVMVYGSSEVDLEALSLLATKYEHYSESRKMPDERFRQVEGQIAWQNIMELRISRRTRPEEDKVHAQSDFGGELPGLLTMAQHSMASNPLDHIYGVLGLACQAWRDALPVDYSLRASELYMRVTRLFRAFCYRLEFLALSSPYKSTDFAELPSWCPDYSLYTKAGWNPLSYPLGLYNECGYHAGYSRAEWEMEASIDGFKPDKMHKMLSDAVSKGIEDTFAHRSNVLSIEGFEIDRIATVIQVPSSWQASSMNETVNEWFDIFAWDEQCLQLSKSVFNSEIAPRAHLRTMTANVTLESRKQTKDMSEIYRLSKIVCSGTYVFPDGVDNFIHIPGFLEHKEEIMEFAATFSAYAKGRSFFSTAKGRIGLGPGFVKEGDMVCIFIDGNMPFILRPSISTDENSYYTVLGEAYVDGVMEGEALNLPEELSRKKYDLV